MTIICSGSEVWKEVQRELQKKGYKKELGLGEDTYNKFPYITLLSKKKFICTWCSEEEVVTSHNFLKWILQTS